MGRFPYGHADLGVELGLGGRVADVGGLSTGRQLADGEGVAAVVYQAVGDGARAQDLWGSDGREPGRLQAVVGGNYNKSLELRGQITS